MSDALRSFDAVAVRNVPPDPGILKAIGLNHGFESAIADLVDNSLDAGAKRVLIRFVLRQGFVTQVLVIDNGRGMDEAEIDTAMQLGKPKAGSEGALGHFGVGLKAASFSQASELTVLSRRRGSAAVGRRMQRESLASGFEVEVLDSSQSAAALADDSTDLFESSGTLVRWDAIRTTPASLDPEVTHAFVESKVASLRNQLGLIFHRLLVPRQFSVEVDVFDSDVGEAGFSFPIDPIDPFAYTRSGAPGYPKVLIARCGTKCVPIECHIWPGGSDSQYFKLFGGPVERFQGFYQYRNDRLLSVGGWDGVVQETKRRKLARVAIDIEGFLDIFSMSVEKSDVHMSADLVHAVEHSEADDGTTFSDYLKDAEETFHQSNRRIRRRTPVLPPGQGIPSRVRHALSRELDFVEGEEPLRIRWTKLADGEFVEVDRHDRTLWLNSEYREAILRGAPGSVNDAPLVKALLFLLYEEVFRGVAYGPKDRDNASVWLEVLTAAAEEEWRGYHT